MSSILHSYAERLTSDAACALGVQVSLSILDSVHLLISLV